MARARSAAGLGHGGSELEIGQGGTGEEEDTVERKSRRGDDGFLFFIFFALSTHRERRDLICFVREKLVNVYVQRTFRLT